MRNTSGWIIAFSVVVLSMSLNAAEGHKDGYGFKGGKVVVYKGGHEDFVTGEVTLRNGARILPDGFIVLRDGRRERFGDRWVSLDGDFDSDVAVVDNDDNFDGYWYDDGHVYVMRDNRPTIVTVDITLGDGSRLSADGTLIRRDGSRDRLAAGARITKEGKPAAAKAKMAQHGNTPNTANRTAESVNATHKAEENKAMTPNTKTPNTATPTATPHETPKMENREGSKAENREAPKGETRTPSAEAPKAAEHSAAPSREAGHEEKK